MGRECGPVGHKSGETFCAMVNVVVELCCNFLGEEMRLEKAAIALGGFARLIMQLTASGCDDGITDTILIR